MGISRLCAPHSRADLNCVLTSFQTNVLVGGDGHARIAGLGMAFVPSAMPVVGGDRSSRAAASDLIGVRPWGFNDTGATMANDVYAFAILAWEVSLMFVVSLDKPLNGIGLVDRFSLGSLHSPTRLLWPVLIRCRRDVDRLGPTSMNSLAAYGR